VTDSFSPSSDPLVSAIVPLYNGKRVVGATLQSLLVQRSVPYEVIVVDDGSTDGSATAVVDLTRGDPRVRLLHHPENQGIPRTLNDGLASARAPYVLILHQDCRLIGDDWLVRAIADLQSGDAAGVVGTPIHNPDRMTRMERCFWVIRNHVVRTIDEPDAPAPPFSENKCDLYRRATLLDVGGFPEGFHHGGEDQFLAAELRRRSLRVSFVPGLRYELTLGTEVGLRASLRKEAFYGRGIRDVARKVGTPPGDGSDRGESRGWLVNRAMALGWPLVLVAAAVLFLLLRLPPYSYLLLVLPPAARLLQLLFRAARYRNRYRLRATDVAGIPFLGLLADLAYLAGFLSPV